VAGNPHDQDDPERSFSQTASGAEFRWWKGQDGQFEIGLLASKGLQKRSLAISFSPPLV